MASKKIVQKPASAIPGVIKANVMKKPAGSSKVVRRKPAKPSADDNRYGCTDDSSDSEVRYHQWFVDTLAEKAIDSKDDHSHILLRTWNSPEKAIDSKEDHSQTATRPERQGLNRA